MQPKINILIVALMVVILAIGAVLLLSGEFGKSPERGEMVSGRGMIAEIDLEEGFFGILADDGSQYRPVNLSADFQRDGLVVEFSGHKVTEEDPYSWGQPIEISEMREELEW